MPDSQTNNPLRLQVLVCTLGKEGLGRTAKMVLPQLDGVGYVVSCQSEPCGIPEPLQRDDIEIYFTPGRGLSRNRNNAFAKTRAEYALIADDDLILTSDGLLAVIETFDSNPGTDIATFRCDFPFHKSYPESETSLPAKTKGYYTTSYEIAVRMESLLRSGLRFNGNMGLGSGRFTAGEEFVFIANALEAGLSCRFFPITIVRHPGIPTGRLANPPAGALEADGVIIAMGYRLSLLPRLLLKAWRSGGSFFSNFRHLLRGAVFQMRHPELFSLSHVQKQDRHLQ